MKVLNNVLWVLVWVFMASACYEDKGNYDYRDLDEIIIDTARESVPTIRLHCRKRLQFL